MSPRCGTLGLIVRTYKAAVTRQARRIGFPKFAWQRNYYEHIIRSAAELERTRNYIESNPAMWDHDEYNPSLTAPRQEVRLVRH
jgi:REP element-mobilizing transposase RayT